MLRAALIGVGSSGKTSLFQLMTSARETARSAHGKGEASIGISKVPDARLDRLTAMYNPKKRVPATVEFSDLAIPGGTGGAQALVDVAAYKNADALVHVLRAFQDPSVPHPSGAVNPARDAQAMEDELILADLGVSERRLERLEKDLKKNKSAELEKERDVITLCKTTLEDGRPLRTLDLKGDDLKRLRGFQFLSAKPLLIVINLDESELAQGGGAATRIDRAAEAAGLTAFLSHAATAAVAVCAKIELEIAQLEPSDAAAFLTDLGLTESGLDRVIRASYEVDSAPYAGADCRGRNPQRYRARVHPGGSGELRSPHRAGNDGRVPGARRSTPRRQGVHRAGRRHHQLPVCHVADDRVTDQHRSGL